MTIFLYAGLFLTMCGYAYALAKLRHIWEPHLTWLEVVIGTTLCLLAPYLDARYGPMPLDWAAYETGVWRAFLIGGAPIIIWQIAQSVRTWRNLERRIGSRNGHTPDPAAPLAHARRRDPADDD